MLTQLTLFIIPITISLISILGGFLMLKFPPKNINMLYGYRTKNSMSSKSNCDFSQKYSSKKIIQIGVLLLTICLVASTFKISENNYSFVIISGIIVGVLFIIAVVPITEYELKKRKNTP